MENSLLSDFINFLVNFISLFPSDNSLSGLCLKKIVGKAPHMRLVLDRPDSVLISCSFAGFWFWCFFVVVVGVVSLFF